jgi:hypothetical protein
MTARAVVVLLGILLLSTGGCRTLTGRSAGEWVDDRAITAKVKARLVAFKPALLTRVNVDTYDATVYLSGTVDSDEIKERAHAVASGVAQVRQVVSHLRVMPARRTVKSDRNDDATAAASPVTDAGATARAIGGPLSAASVSATWPGIARVEPRAGGPQYQTFAAYDRAGRVVATLYAVAMRDLARVGLDDLRADGRSIDHVTIVPIAAHGDVPEAFYHVVLWHVTRAEAAALQ